jgi:hypothetical protein
MLLQWHHVAAVTVDHELHTAMQLQAYVAPMRLNRELAGALLYTSHFSSTIIFLMIYFFAWVHNSISIFSFAEGATWTKPLAEGMMFLLLAVACVAVFAPRLLSRPKVDQRELVKMRYELSSGTSVLVDAVEDDASLLLSRGSEAKGKETVESEPTDAAAGDAGMQLEQAKDGSGDSDDAGESVSVDHGVDRQTAGGSGDGEVTGTCRPGAPDVGGGDGGGVGDSGHICALPVHTPLHLGAARIRFALRSSCRQPATLLPIGLRLGRHATAPRRTLHALPMALPAAASPGDVPSLLLGCMLMRCAVAQLHSSSRQVVCDKTFNCWGTSMPFAGEHEIGLALCFERFGVSERGRLQCCTGDVWRVGHGTHLARTCHVRVAGTGCGGLRGAAAWIAKVSAPKRAHGGLRADLSRPPNGALRPVPVHMRDVRIMHARAATSGGHCVGRLVL